MTLTLESLRYTKAPAPKLEVLDQLLIPQKKEYIKIASVEAAWGVIRSMQIRGKRSDPKRGILYFETAENLTELSS